MTTRVERFRFLHNDFLVVPCVWDAASAVLIAGAGTEVIGTTSAGMAWSRGRPDGALTAGDLVTAVESITTVTDALLTVDIGDGYSADVRQVVDLVDDLAALGVVGVNLEDTTGGAQLPVAEAAQRLAGLRAGLRARGRDVFLNARIDTWLHGRDDLDDVLQRAAAYVQAGAEGVFIPAAPTPDEASHVVAAVDRPINVMSDGTVSHDRWRRAGVRRVSSGMTLTQACLAAVQPVLRGWCAGTLDDDMIDFADMQALVAAGAR